MSYQQLTEGKRYQIAALIAQGLRPSEIARIINVHRVIVKSGVWAQAALLSD